MNAFTRIFSMTGFFQWAWIGLLTGTKSYTFVTTPGKISVSIFLSLLRSNDWRSAMFYTVITYSVIGCVIGTIIGSVYSNQSPEARNSEITSPVGHKLSAASANLVPVVFWLTIIVGALSAWLLPPLLLNSTLSLQSTYSRVIFGIIASWYFGNKVLPLGEMQAKDMVVNRNHQQ